MTENLNRHMDKVTDMLKTVEQLIACGRLKRHDNKVFGDLTVNTVYDDEASMVVVEHGMEGQNFPMHIHKDCVQFLICIVGKFAVVTPEVSRVLDAEDCFSVPKNMPHSVHCLKDGSKLIGVVIPAEPSYRTK